LERSLAIATRAAERGAQVTRQLLTFSRQQILNPKLIDPAARLPDLATLLRSTLRGDITLDAEIAAELPMVAVDPGELELALINLALNARDAMPSGGRLRLAAEHRRLRDERLGIDGDYLVIELADDGDGIPPDVLPRVFEPFFTTKEVGAGTGLGLSQVYGFASQSGGAVDIESAPGEGTKVRLFLPVAVAVEGRPQPEIARPQHRHTVTTGSILVVEDDVDVAELAAGALQRCGFTVTLAHRARAALDLLRGGKFDAVLSDVVMPDGMSGIELAAEVRSSFPEIPVLLVSGFSEALADAARHGLQIIAKPFQTQELCESVSGLLVRDEPSAQP
jgi:two-component system NtrC family sensor kinase